MPSAKIFGLVFRKPRLAQAALCHPSYRNETPCPNLENFDRMEFFGDAVLNFVICKRLYRLFPNADEGTLSRIRSILVSRKILTRIAEKIGLPKKIKMGRSLLEHPNFIKTKIVSDCLEAMIAAVYFDRGLQASENFILKNFKPYFNLKRLYRLDPNPKSTLQELSLKLWQKLPLYESRPLPGGIEVTVAAGPKHKMKIAAATRREAEEKAAQLLIRKIRQWASRRAAKPAPSRKSLRGRASKRSSAGKLRRTR